MATRRIDDLGRIVIPKEMREVLAIECGDALDLELDGRTVVIKKHYDDRLDELQFNIALLEDAELRDKLFAVLDSHNRKGDTNA